LTDALKNSHAKIAAINVEITAAKSEGRSIVFANGLTAAANVENQKKIENSQMRLWIQ
jgi:hypothetical protein